MMKKYYFWGLKMKNEVLVLFLITFVCGGCSLRELNLPLPSPMPVRIAPDSEPYTSCAVQFTKEMNFSEVAITAIELQSFCGLSEYEIRELAKKL